MEEFLKEHGFEYNSNDENLMEAKWDEDDSSYLADGLGNRLGIRHTFGTGKP